VLVVDDAVDSGATLIAVLDAVYKAAGSSKVRSAAITVTTENPMVMPDYYLYHDETLIRFPWSIDAN
jgi:hypoxanthine phosphoribosyltransferase